MFWCSRFTLFKMGFQISIIWGNFHTQYTRLQIYTKCTIVKWLMFHIYFILFSFSHHYYETFDAINIFVEKITLLVLFHSVDMWMVRVLYVHWNFTYYMTERWIWCKMNVYIRRTNKFSLGIQDSSEFEKQHKDCLLLYIVLNANDIPFSLSNYLTSNHFQIECALCTQHL